MTQQDLYKHIRNPENYTAVRDLVSDRWLGHAYRTVAGHFRAVRFFDVGLSDGPYATVEDAIEAVYLSWHASPRRRRAHDVRACA